MIGWSHNYPLASSALNRVLKLIFYLRKRIFVSSNPESTYYMQIIWHWSILIRFINIVIWIRELSLNMGLGWGEMLAPLARWCYRSIDSRAPQIPLTRGCSTTEIFIRFTPWKVLCSVLLCEPWCNSILPKLPLHHPIQHTPSSFHPSHLSPPPSRRCGTVYLDVGDIWGTCNPRP